MLQNKNVVKETTGQFEQWMKQRVTNKNFQHRNEAEIITIPIVIHIIHNGEPVGEGLNVPDEQIFSQVDVLNEDFRRLNDDRINTPSEFLPVAADIELYFELASRDPEGLSTNGIVRVNGNRPQWELADNYLLKSLSYWPAEDYLNIWVTDLGSGFLGFAQFPVSPLEGLEDASNSRLTDGVTLDFRAFGSISKFPAADLNPKYDLGRTASHEVGHFFGLRHIWGDGNCNVDDFCDDTPLQSSSNSGLNNCTFPGKNTCTSETPDLPDMFQNFMDYTNDVCMNLFTADQKARMRTVLDNSPRRVSLKNSLGTTPPTIVSNDLGIRQLLSPTFAVCGETFSTQIEVRNYGNNAISNFTINVNIDGELVTTITSNNVLNPLDIESIMSEDISIPEVNEFTITLEVVSVNGTSDENTSNNIFETIINVPEVEPGSFTENFNQVPENWLLSNLDGLRTWELVTAPNGNPTNQALSINFYDYENEGAIDLYSSPSFSLSAESSARLVFDLSYAKLPSVDFEGLLVVIGRECENPLTDADTIYYKESSELATVGTSSLNFSPTSSADWRQEEVDLAAYLGESSLQITFIGKNGWGNNIYIDNISIEKVENRIVAPTVVTCINDQELLIEVINNEPVDINSIDLSYVIDGSTPKNLTIPLNEPLPPGFSTVVGDDLGPLNDGIHNIEVTINPNGSSTTILQHQFYIDKAGDRIPIRENMSDLENSSWLIINSDNDITWEAIEGHIQIDNSNYTTLNERDWFVSPILDFSEAEFAALTFEVAYSSEGNSVDGLSVLVSTDCGESYSDIEYIKFADDLITGSFTDSPSLSDWRTETIDLNGYVGIPEVRIAFASTNKNGNILYLDDIQVYASNFTSSTDDIIFPNPSFDGQFNLRFDLQQKENITIIIYSSGGQQITSEKFEGTLNQLYTFDISNSLAGIYFVRIIGESFTTTRRLIKSN